MPLIEVVVTILVLSAFLTYAADTTKILIIGQSNAAGRALLDGDTLTTPGIYMYCKGEIVPAHEPVGRCSPHEGGAAKKGFAMACARHLQTLGHEEILLVNYAVGSTSISQWITSYIQGAIAVAEDVGGVDYVLWHQGEQDAIDLTRATMYSARLDTLVGFVEDTLDCPMICGEIGRWWDGVSYHPELVNDAIKSHRHVSSEGLAPIDSWHFDFASCETLGVRFAEEIGKKTKPPRIPVVLKEILTPPLFSLICLVKLVLKRHS